MPGIFGPTIDDVYLMISVSGGKRTPSRDDGSLKLKKETKMKNVFELNRIGLGCVGFELC